MDLDQGVQSEFVPKNHYATRAEHNGEGGGVLKIKTHLEEVAGAVT